MSRRKTLNKKGVLLDEEPKRIEKLVYKNGHMQNVYIFDCIGDCGNELRIQGPAKIEKSTGKCRSCCQRGLPFEASYNELINRYDHHKKDVTITYKEYYELCKNVNCHYCNDNLNRKPYTKFKGKDVPNSRAYMLDRMDNRIGYTKDNVVNCCWKCNAAKGDRYSYEEWYNMTEYLRNKNKNK